MSKKNYTPLISNKESNPSFIEAYRTLFTNIQFCQPSRPLKTLLITSSGPQEGKSTIVANLGIILAQAGNKVLLVDSDLRAPTLCEIFKVANSSGLSDLLIEVYSTQITQGRLEDFSVGDALQLLKIQKKTGILTIEQQEATVSFFLKKGEVVEVRWKKVPPIEDLKEVFRVKDGTFQFQETSSLDDHIDILDNPRDKNTLRKTILQIYRQPFIERSITSFLKPTHIDNLQLLTSGRLPPNPPQLLGSESMKTLVSMVRNRFDAVIFDSPPFGSVVDASVLASIVDGVILVIRKGFYDKRLIQRTKEALETVSSNICGVVLNQVDLKRDGYYYAGYQYGYYYKKDHKVSNKN